MAGIPITVAMKKINEMNDTAGGHKFYPRVGPEEPRPAENEEDYLSTIEKDFSSDAELILERLNLSHMKTKKTRL
jgi:hypothetical protein